MVLRSLAGRLDKHSLSSQVGRYAAETKVKNKLAVVLVASLFSVTGLSTGVAASGTLQRASESAKVFQVSARAPLGLQLLCLKSPTACKTGGADRVTMSSNMQAQGRPSAHLKHLGAF